MKQLSQNQIIEYQTELGILRHQLDQITVELDDVYNTGYVVTSDLVITGVFQTIVFGFFTYIFYHLEWAFLWFLVLIGLIAGIGSIVIGVGISFYQIYLKSEYERKAWTMQRIDFIEGELEEHDAYMLEYVIEEELTEEEMKRWNYLQELRHENVFQYVRYICGEDEDLKEKINRIERKEKRKKEALES